MLYNFGARLVNAFLLLNGSKAKVYGKENLPQDGGYVIACTHNGYVDIFNLGVSIFPRQIHFMAKKQLFESKGFGWLFPQLNAFPVDRENPGPSSIKTPVKLVQDKKIVGIFPSGTRTSEDVPLKKGAATIANLARVPIVPAAYSGPTDLKGLLRGRKIHVIFGDPISLKKEDGTKKDPADITRELSDVMAQLQNELDKRGGKQ